MKRIILIFAILSFISCCSDRIASLPDYWEYSPGKWVAFKENIEIEWSYDGLGIDKFEISRVKMKLAKDEIQELKKLIRKNKIDDIIAKEKALRQKINPDEQLKVYNSLEKLNFKDTNKPIPRFGEVCYYQVCSMKNHEFSWPAELSVIFIERTKK